jgi:hypothetical protein
MSEVWGARRGYCFYCSDFVDDEPIWQQEVRPDGSQVIIACCLQCAIDKGVINL